MLNFRASKPRVKGGARAPGPPPGSAPELNEEFSLWDCEDSEPETEIW